MRNEDNKSFLEAFCGVIYSAGGGGRGKIMGDFQHSTIQVSALSGDAS
jgi:hypothetical protein